MKIKNILKNNQVKNAGWLIGGKIAQMIISLVVGSITARYLGPSNYGLIGYVSAYIAFFNSFCTLGINSILVKEFLDDPSKEGVILGSSLVLRAVSSILSALSIICLVLFVDAGETDTIMVAALCSIGVVFHVFEIFNYWFQAHLKSKITAIAAFVAYCATALYRVILIVTGQSVYLFALATSIDYVCVAVFLVIAYYKNGGRKLGFSWSEGKRIIGKSHHFILSGLMVAIYGQTDKIMLKQMMGEAEVGFYTTATTVCGMWCFILAAIIDSAYPSIVEANKNDEDLFKRRNRQLYALVFYLSACVSLLFQVFGPLVIRILYGEQYMNAVSPMRIATWYIAFSYLGAARDAWIVCKGCQKYLKHIYFGAAACNVVLNLILIPLWGASGAALASLISQILTSIVLPLFIKDLRPNAKLMLEAILLKGVFPHKKAWRQDK